MSVLLNGWFLLNQSAFRGFDQVKPCSSWLLWFEFRVVRWLVLSSSFKKLGQS